MTKAYIKSNPETIKSMFNSIATRYDLTNSVLSLCMHKRWNRALVKKVLNNKSSNTLLDLCSGTGDIAIDYLQTTNQACQAYLIDFSQDMLNCAKEKTDTPHFSHHTLKFIEADVQQIPLDNEIADCATMAYGIRNVKDPILAIKEVHRLLKPGGCFAILELTQPQNRAMRLGHYLYLRLALPLLGKWLTANEEAYQYLRNSINTFITPKEIENLMVLNGFTETVRQPLAGGIATIIYGKKSESPYKG